MDRSDAVPPSFVAAMRFGTNLAIATTVNKSKPLLFPIDSGAALSMLDEETAKQLAFMTGNQGLAVCGVQGRTSNGSVANQVTR